MDLPRLNKAGRVVWFVRPPPSEGAVRPVTPEGTRLLLFAVALIPVCAIGTMVGMLVVPDFRPVIAGFLILVLGLGACGLLAWRHIE